MTQPPQPTIAAPDRAARLLVLIGSVWGIILVAATAFTFTLPDSVSSEVVLFGIIPFVVAFASLRLANPTVQAWVWLICAGLVATIATALIFVDVGSYLFPVAVLYIITMLYTVAFGRMTSDRSTPPRSSRLTVLAGSLWGIALLGLIALAVAGSGDEGLFLMLTAPYVLALLSLLLPDSSMQPPLWLGCAMIAMPVAIITLLSGVGFFLLPVALLYAIGFGRATYFF